MRAMDDRLLARLIAAGRVLFGAGCLFAPKLMFAKPAKDASGPMVWMLRAFGIRDIVLGAGALQSLQSPDPDPTWVAFGALADTADVVSALVTRDELGPSSLAATLAIAVPAALIGWKATIGLRRAEARLP